jgi:glycosyltransferase involved in cell wall biosynthesis
MAHLMTRVDLHLHSRFSRRPEEWVFRKAGVAKSYSDPRELYDGLMGKGFRFFTLTDHHTLDGCAALEGLPGVFLSEQVTALFPEDGVAVELLVWGLNHGQHGRILELRENIYHLQAYLSSEGLAHAVAHPFFVPDGRMQPGHVEKLLLLFKHFEARNGLRAELTNQFTEVFLQSLAPVHLERMADRHEISPTHVRPWEKILVGGSDDQAGLFAGRAWTSSPEAETVEEFLANIREGRCFPEGQSGGPLTVAHGLYNKIRHFLGESFEPVRSSPLAQNAFARFMEGKDPTHITWRQKWDLAAGGILSGKIFELLKPANASLWMTLAGAVDGAVLKQEMRRLEEEGANAEDRAFKMANLLASRLSFHFISSFVEQVTRGNIVRAIQDLAVLLPILAPLTPYLFELHREAPNAIWLKSLSRTVHGRDLPILEGRKVAWFSDTLEDINGVSKTICNLATEGVAAGFDVTVVSCRKDSVLQGVPLKNFDPIGEFALPEYELQKLAFPPFLEIIEYIHRERFTDIILSTPGPMGLVGLLAARLLGLPVRGIYHTDFPRYVRILTDDGSLETLAWTYMHWFYTGLDELFVNSEPYRQAWVERGASPWKLRILPRGLDVSLFNPRRRVSGFWAPYGLNAGEVVLLYVGRVSKEKGLDMLESLSERLKGLPARIAIVGDGPYRAELKELLPEAIFTGYLSGETLAEAYASSDVFLFPSTTDTYGNVVIEALASGLPCLVSDEGGPSGLVRHGQTGFITRARDVADFTAQAIRLVIDIELRSAMGRNAAASAVGMDWAAAAKLFFSESVG